MKRDPILITSALLSALGPLIGNGIWAGPTGDDEQVLAAVRDGLPARAYVAFGLELVGFAAMVVLFAWLVAFLIRVAPVAAAATGLAGAATLAVKVGSAAPAMTAYSLADRLDATTVKMLFDLNDGAFVIDGFFTSIAVCAAGVGLLRADIPRWLAWWPAVVGALGVIAAAIGIITPAAYVPVPFLLLLVWMIALAIRSAMGGKEAESATARLSASTMAA
ncbi:MAG: DUF4386 family protein [Frankiaceae bacterium]|nr:DUF4386 family protein [Frankiaceae bacterium]